MLGRVGIGAHEAEAPVGVVRARRPHLLPVDDELVADELGARAQAREVAPRVGLAHPEAPRDLGAQRREEELRLLLRGAVVLDRRSDDAEALRVRARARSRARSSPRSRSSARSVTRCARRARAANRVRANRCRTVCVATRAPTRACARSTASVRRRDSSPGSVRLQPRDELGAETLFLGCVLQAHRGGE